MKLSYSFRIERVEAIDLYSFYVSQACQCVRSAVAVRRWFSDDDGAKWRARYSRYITDAKSYADKARRWAKKLGMHFGTKSVSQRAEDKRRLEELILSCEHPQIPEAA